MGTSPRRIYIYPPLQQDDGAAASPFWPPGRGFPQLSDDQLPSPSSDNFEGNVSQGGLLGMLLRAMQQNRDQPGVDSGSAANDEPDGDSYNNGSPQGESPEGHTALPAELYPSQPFARNNELPLSDPRNPNFRQLARIPHAGRSQAATDPSNQPGEQSSPPYFSLGGNNSPDRLHGSRRGDQAALPDRSFADRLQAYWNHPHPYGVISTLKQTLDGMAQAVQGSIDATTVPSTEEQAFRQNLGRERGPIGAWQAASVLNPVVPGGTGGIFARPLVDAITNRGLARRAGEWIGSQGIEGQMANIGFPSAGLAAGNHPPGLRSPAVLANDKAAPPGAVLPSPMHAVPRLGGGLLAPRAKPSRRSVAPMPTDEEDGGGDGGNPCLNRWIGEYNRCDKFYMLPRVGNRYREACRNRAADRLRLCNRNGRMPDPEEPEEFDWIHIPKDTAKR